MFIFQTRQFPRQLCRLDQWKCFVWSTKLWMFVKETWHVLVTWSACSTKLTTFFRVLEAWCHCNFREIDALNVNKFGWPITLGHRRPKLSLTDGLSSRFEDLLFFKSLCKRSARETWHSYRHHLLHNTQNMTQRMEVFQYGEKRRIETTDISGHEINFFFKKPSGS